MSFLFNRTLIGDETLMTILSSVSGDFLIQPSKADACLCNYVFHLHRVVRLRDRYPKCDDKDSRFNGLFKHARKPFQRLVFFRNDFHRDKATVLIYCH